MNNLGYPDEEELSKIAHWPYQEESIGCFYRLMLYVRELWHWDDYFVQVDDNNSELWTRGRFAYNNNFELHTGGWSGNEQIICALQENTLFWAMCWEESKKGGHYKFNIME